MNIANCYNQSMEFNRKIFSQFIIDEYITWRGKTERTWTDYAAYLGVTQQTMAAWKNGYLKRQPTQENINKLLAVFGARVYPVLGIEPPSISSVLSKLPPDVSAKLQAAFDDIANMDIATTSPDAKEKIIEVFSRHGVKFNVSE